MHPHADMGLPALRETELIISRQSLRIQSAIYSAVSYWLQNKVLQPSHWFGTSEQPQQT